MNLRKEYCIHPERCIRCDRCMAICPVKAIKLAETSALQVDKYSCRRCGACKKVCKQRAITSRVRLQF
ncbi:4Fe-4S binding protein [Sporomusa sp.]|uniref:4Fe-4S binding protein n=1 Tax=Sporomusa sp. TaxID=2078658 RepID=UPI002C42DC9C|nr:4Fe-4S binding protein [Sporomusa sp.]HWR09010.1 4Fe-4S binding protein [Sporomusa sp.]